MKGEIMDLRKNYDRKVKISNDSELFLHRSVVQRWHREQIDDCIIKSVRETFWCNDVVQAGDLFHSMIDKALLKLVLV